MARLLQGRVIRGCLREKEYGEGKSARFRRSLLRERDGQFPCQIHLLEGILLAEGSLVALYDVEFAYEHGAERQVMELVDRLLSEENEYTLAEPDPALRLQAMVGRAYPPLAGRVRLNRAALREMRSGGGLGALNTASVSGDPGAAPHSWPGNRLAV